MPGVMNDSRSDVLPAPRSYAVQQPQPILVDTPKVTEAAKSGIRAGTIVRQRARDNIPEARQVVADMRTDQLKALASLSPTIAAKLQEQEEAEFQRGYIRHLQGESIKEIGEDDPLRKIFGDGAAVRGARMREQEAAGLALASWVQENQGDLVRMTLDEQREAIGGYVETLGTGDPQSDAMIAQGVMKMLPPMLNTLARGHVEEQQKQAAIAQSETIKQGADTLKFAAGEVAKGRMSEESYAQVQGQYLEAIRPLPGQTPDAYRAAMTSNYLMLLKDGQFDMANTIESKVLGPILDSSEQLQLYNQGKQAQALWLTDNPVSKDYSMYSETLPAQIQAGRFRSVDGLLQSIDDMNTRYKNETGNVYPLIDNKERARYADYFVKNSLREAEKAQAAAAARAEKALEAETKRTLYLQGYSHGDPSLMAASGLDTTQRYAIDQQVTVDLFSSPNIGTAETLGTLAINGGVNPLVKQELTKTLGKLANGMIPSQAEMQNLQVAATKFNNVSQSDAAYDAYFGGYAQEVKGMLGYDLTDPKSLEGFAQSIKSKKFKATADSTVRDYAKEAASEMTPSFWSRMVGDGRKLGEGATQRLTQQAEGELISVLAENPNLPLKEAQAVATRRVMSKNTLLGNYVIEGDRNKTVFGTLNKHLKVPIQDPTDTRINVIFDDYIKARVGEKDYTVGSISAPNNQAEYMVATIVDSDGISKVVPIYTQKAAEMYNAKLTKDAEPAKQRQQEVRQYNVNYAEAAKQIGTPVQQNYSATYAEQMRGK